MATLSASLSLEVDMIRRVVVVLCVSLCWPGGAEEPPAKPPAEDGTIALEATGGERVGARQPDIAEVERRVEELSNAFRKEEKRSKLTSNEQLTAAAQALARHMAQTSRFGHQADGKTPAERATAAKYTFCSVRENIAYAFRSDGYRANALAEEFVEGWKKSPGHRVNLLAPEITEIGVAVVKGKESDAYFAVQLFGRPESLAVRFEIVNESAVTVRYRIGERPFDLPANFTRTHTECDTTKVEFLPLAGADGKIDPQAKPVEAIEAGDGERLSVETAGKAYRVTVRTKGATK